MSQKARKFSEQLVQRETMRENLIKSQKKSLKELTRIEGALLAGGFLTEQELNEAL